MARGASNVQRELNAAHRQLVEATRYLTGADSDAVKGAAKVLQQAIRKKLSTAAVGRRTSIKTRRTYGGTPSLPGQAPHMQSGKARRSVKSAVVNGVRRVGTDDYRLRLLEFGAIADAQPARMSRKGHTVVWKDGRREYRLLKDSKQHLVKATRRRVLEPRPSFEPALAEAMPKMQDVFVDELSRRIAKRVGKGA